FGRHLLSFSSLDNHEYRAAYALIHFVPGQHILALANWFEAFQMLAQKFVERCRRQREAVALDAEAAAAAGRDHADDVASRIAQRPTAVAWIDLGIEHEHVFVADLWQRADHTGRQLQAGADGVSQRIAERRHTLAAIDRPTRRQSQRFELHFGRH